MAVRILLSLSPLAGLVLLAAMAVFDLQTRWLLISIGITLTLSIFATLFWLRELSRHQTLQTLVGEYSSPIQAVQHLLTQQALYGKKISDSDSRVKQLQLLLDTLEEQNRQLQRRASGHIRLQTAATSRSRWLLHLLTESLPPEQDPAFSEDTSADISAEIGRDSRIIRSLVLEEMETDLNPVVNTLKSVTKPTITDVHRAIEVANKIVSQLKKDSGLNIQLHWEQSELNSTLAHGWSQQSHYVAHILLKIVLSELAKGSKSTQLTVSRHEDHIRIDCSSTITESTDLTALLNRVSGKKVGNNTLEFAISVETVKQTLRTLAVDDNAANLRLLTLNLTSLGFDVVSARNGAEALATLDRLHHNKSESDIDIVMLDLHLPDLTGYELAHIIQRKYDNSHVLFAVTAHLDDAEKANVTRTFEGYLIKPATVSGLARLLSPWLPGQNNPPKKPAVAAGRSNTMAIYDRAFSIEIANNNPEIADELISLLVQNLDADIGSINESWQLEDMPSLRQNVHRLTGACRYCGVPRLEQAVERLESAIKRQTHKDLTPFVNLVTTESGILVRWFEQEYLPGRDSNPGGREEG